MNFWKNLVRYLYYNFKFKKNMKHPKEEKTFVMVKPDGVRKGLTGEIIRRFEQRDLKIVALEMFQPTRGVASTRVG